MDTNTRQLAALVAQTFERFEAAVLTCLPADKRREVVLSPAWIEFRLALAELTPPRGGMGGGPTDPDKTGKTLQRVVAASNARPWEEEAGEMGLVIRRPSEHQVQFMQEEKVLADWWPSKDTTMMDGKRGPRCGTGEAVIAWLKSV